LSQPDYTQVSPAKLALRRHLSQEKLAQHQGPPMPGQLTTKTIGDFINSEIEKTLEITPQSIINAVIQHNMPSSSRHEVIDCSINQERDLDDHHPYATLKPTGSKQQQYMHDPYADHRSKMLPITSKYISPTSSGAGSSTSMRKSAISTPPLRSGHDEYQQESSYKIDTKMFTSNIGMTMRKEEKAPVVEHEPPLEGLAASLRQHVIASMKIKEESENEPKFPTYPPMPYPHIIKKECKLTLDFIEGDFNVISFTASNRMKRSSPVILHQRPQGGGMQMYNDMSEDMMYPPGPSSGSNERNLTPLSRHRVDEGS
jgi:hypothetical protein